MDPPRRIRCASATRVRFDMRPGLGIAIGGTLAVLGGASVAVSQAAAPTAELVSPAGALGGSLLGAADPVPAVPGFSPAWVLRTLPLGSQAAPAPGPNPVVAAAPVPAAPPAPAHASSPVIAVLTSLPVRLTSPIPAFPHLPIPVSLPHLPVRVSLPIHLPAGGGRPVAGSGGHHPHGSGTGHQRHHGGSQG